MVGGPGKFFPAAVKKLMGNSYQKDYSFPNCSFYKAPVTVVTTTICPGIFSVSPLAPAAIDILFPLVAPVLSRVT
jgi:hypothetical protein